MPSHQNARRLWECTEWSAPDCCACVTKTELPHEHAEEIFEIAVCCERWMMTGVILMKRHETLFSFGHKHSNWSLCLFEPNFNPIYLPEVTSLRLKTRCPKPMDLPEIFVWTSLDPTYKTLPIPRSTCSCYMHHIESYHHDLLEHRSDTSACTTCSKSHVPSHGAEIPPKTGPQRGNKWQRPINSQTKFLIVALTWKRSAPGQRHLGLSRSTALPGCRGGGLLLPPGTLEIKSCAEFDVEFKLAILRPSSHEGEQMSLPTSKMRMKQVIGKHAWLSTWTKSKCWR